MMYPNPPRNNANDYAVGSQSAGTFVSSSIHDEAVQQARRQQVEMAKQLAETKPRDPRLSEKIGDAAERCGSLHQALSMIESHLNRIIPNDAPPGTAGEKVSEPYNSDRQLAMVLESMAHLEGRMATIANRMERYL
jgi:hypothetical protein